MLFIIIFNSSIKVVSEAESIRLFQFIILTVLALIWPIVITLITIVLLIQELSINPIIIKRQL
jgi:hypothetical protein